MVLGASLSITVSAQIPLVGFFCMFTEHGTHATWEIGVPTMLDNAIKSFGRDGKAKADSLIRSFEPNQESEAANRGCDRRGLRAAEPTACPSD